MTRRIIEISGPDAAQFLQGLITNDVGRASDALVYAALLTPQGKYIADFFVTTVEDGFWLDVDAELAPLLMQRLTMYKLRADVSLSETDHQVRRGIGPAPKGALADPRRPELGWRLYGDAGGDDGTDWDAIRVAHCIPESGIELTPETYILEAGFERLNGVDFRKGCYVGQEIAARMKHKTELRKGLRTVDITGSAPVGAPITADGRPVGTLYTQAEGRAIAYLRLDRAKGDMLAGDSVVTLTN